jgi:hypothetical protein
MQQISEQVDHRPNRIVGKAGIYVSGELHSGYAAIVLIGEYSWWAVEKCLSGDMKSRAVADT